MENQRRKIKGYMELSQEEIDLMNEVKALEAKFMDLNTRIITHLTKQELSGDEGRERSIQSEAGRWLNIGKTDIQKGFMAVIRSIAQPTHL